MSVSESCALCTSFSLLGNADDSKRVGPMELESNDVQPNEAILNGLRKMSAIVGRSAHIIWLVLEQRLQEVGLLC